MGVKLHNGSVMRSVLLPLAVSIFVLAACSSEADDAGAGGDNGTLAGADGVGGSSGSSGSSGASGSTSGSSGASGSSGTSEPAPTPTDGKKNGTETDADCGGANAPKCADGKGCKDAGDCESGVCNGTTCAVPNGTDGVKNGDETDVDCGGTKTGAPKCAATKICAQHSDCASDGCGYDKKCALAPSCAAHFGGDTCGSGEVGEAGAKHESCCTAAPIPGNATMRLDKYLVTAGRFRQFVERTNGDLKGTMEKIGAGNASWNASWNSMLPTNIAETNFYLGPTGHTPRAGCDLGESRARTYWMSDAENQALGETGTHLFSKDVLDTKALNCVEWYMLQAFCVWDGGRLPTAAEFKAAWQAGENRAWPWGGGALDPSRVVHKFNYSFPEVYDKGNWVFQAAPGRIPSGYSKNGHADLAGATHQWLGDISGADARISLSGSWENHVPQKDGQASGLTPAKRAYWAIGGRCVRP